MTSMLRRFAAATLIACGFSMPASASTSGIDYTDIWYNPAESGWGINIIQQGATLFATVFVYSADRTPHWFVASEMNGGPNAFSGTLFQTSGPGYNGPWTGGVTAPPVGSISVNFTGVNSGTLSYTASGVTVTKTISRQSFRANTLTGSYYGGFVAHTNCTPPAAAVQGPFTVTHSGTSVTIRLPSPGTTVCTLTGTYSAQGRLATVTGTSSCSGIAGNFTISELDASKNGMNGVFAMSDSNGCSFNGYFGGTRDQQ
jgi:hypothetical protein